jgi:hypothetical protein
MPLNYRMGFGFDRIPGFRGKTDHMLNDIGAAFPYPLELLDGESPALSGPPPNQH